MLLILFGFIFPGLRSESPTNPPYGINPSATHRLFTHPSIHPSQTALPTTTPHPSSKPLPLHNSSFTPLIPINSVSKTTPPLISTFLPPRRGKKEQRKTRRKKNHPPSVDPAGIGPVARSPYPNSGGIVNVRLSPTHMSNKPSSQLTHFHQSFIHQPASPPPPLSPSLFPKHKNQNQTKLLTTQKTTKTNPLITIPLPTVNSSGSPRS